jgi:hypothetical protein
MKKLCLVLAVIATIVAGCKPVAPPHPPQSSAGVVVIG